jgi:hypothetical protein
MSTSTDERRSSRLQGKHVRISDNENSNKSDNEYEEPPKKKKKIKQKNQTKQTTIITQKKQ